MTTRGRRKRLNVVHANVIYRVLARLNIIAERLWNVDEKDARAMYRLIGGLEYEVFGGVMYDQTNPLAEQRPTEDVCKAL